MAENVPMGRGLGMQSTSQGGKNKRIATGVLASPTAFSRTTRDMNRTRKKQDRKIGSRRMS